MSVSPYANRIPFFSVLMCTYNRAQLLPRAITSLLAQTETDWELIIIDDGSTDNTFEVLQPYILKHENIRYMYQQNRGLGSSRNAGVLAACGLFVTFLDSDDEYLPNHLLIRKTALVQNNDVHFIHGGIEVIGNPYVPDKDDNTKLIHLDECVVGGTFVLRRDMVLALGGYPHIRFADDAAFYQIAVDAGVPIAKIDSPTYRYYRDTPDSLCNTMGGL